jgi:hypothetical protein
LVGPITLGIPRRLGDVNAHDAGWAPDGQQIVYANGSSLYLVKRDGSDVHKLAAIVGVPLVPVFSPDGTRVRFTVNDPKTASSSLWELGIDGTGLHPVLQGWNAIANECCGKMDFGWAILCISELTPEHFQHLDSTRKVFVFPKSFV